MLLDGKRILITGASSGIGRSLAWEFARKGAIPVLAARSEDSLRELAGEMAATYPDRREPLAIGCDVTDAARVQALMQRCDDVLGGIDVLVNNAGVCVYGEAVRTARDDFREVMEVNYFGALNCTFAALPLLKALRAGLVVNIASVAAIHGVPYLCAYSASKAALVAFGQSLRAELSGSGVAVLNVYPSYTRTPLFDHEKRVGGACRPEKGYADAADVAASIVHAVERDRHDLVLSRAGRSLSLLQGLFPALADRAMARIASRLGDPKEQCHA